MAEEAKQVLLNGLESADRWRASPELALTGYRRTILVMADEIERLVQREDDWCKAEAKFYDIGERFIEAAKLADRQSVVKWMASEIERLAAELADTKAELEACRDWAVKHGGVAFGAANETPAVQMADPDPADKIPPLV